VATVPLIANEVLYYSAIQRPHLAASVGNSALSNCYLHLKARTVGVLISARAAGAGCAQETPVWAVNALLPRPGAHHRANRRSGGCNAMFLGAQQPIDVSARVLGAARPRNRNVTNPAAGASAQAYVRIVPSHRGNLAAPRPPSAPPRRRFRSTLGRGGWGLRSTADQARAGGQEAPAACGTFARCAVGSPIGIPTEVRAHLLQDGLARSQLCALPCPGRRDDAARYHDSDRQLRSQRICGPEGQRRRTDPGRPRRCCSLQRDLGQSGFPCSPPPRARRLGPLLLWQRGTRGQPSAPQGTRLTQLTQHLAAARRARAWGYKR
jgi:hypothetical protein